MIKKNNYISLWLLLSTILVALIIILGGLTRLTDSGLSITRWDLISGILPPLNSNDWNNLFDLYKEIPEYKLLKSTITLNEFKIIYYWEYAHRLLGRIIGIFFLIPLIYFTLKKSLAKKIIIQLWLIFLLIVIQGIIGWYMVKSGLVERTDVSHYRLSLHLTFAFIIFILLLWNFLKYQKFRECYLNKKMPFYLLSLFLLLTILQISLGAFVSGLDAGMIYQTWPLMNDGYFPNDSSLKELFSYKAFDTPSLVQFIHRNLAYLIFLIFLVTSLIIFNNKDFSYLRLNTLIVFVLLLLQIFLGIITVITGAQIYIASMHQIGSIFLVSSTLILIFKSQNFS